MRFRVLQEELDISQRRETMECNRRRNFGTEIPEEKQEFCQKYDFIIDLAKEQLATVSVFNLVYSTVEPILLREIEARKARDTFRVWIHQKLNCLEDDYRCANNEREMLRRITKGKQEVLDAYHAALMRLEESSIQMRSRPHQCGAMPGKPARRWGFTTRRGKNWDGFHPWWYI